MWPYLIIAYIFGAALTAFIAGAVFDDDIENEPGFILCIMLWPISLPVSLLVGLMYLAIAKPVFCGKAFRKYLEDRKNVAGNCS